MSWLKYKKIYLIISSIALAVSMVSLVSWGLRLSVDFVGGSIVEYQFRDGLENDDIRSEIERNEILVSTIQKSSEGTHLIRLQPLTPEERIKVASAAAVLDENSEELRFETVGPSIGPELVRKTLYAILISAGAIVFWIAWQFKSLKFGLSAILATLHDSLILIGAFSLLGRIYGVEVDFLFATALLITISFSVHDTIVMFDRIRELSGKHKVSVYEVADRAVSETIVRSLNNSFTMLFMLVALFLLGGESIKWFMAALIVGVVSGTYSSPFVAVPILANWDDVASTIKGKVNFKFLKRR